MKLLHSATIAFAAALLHPAYAQDKPDAPPPSKAAPLGTTSAPKADHPAGAAGASTGKMGAKKKSGMMAKGHRRK